MKRVLGFLMILCLLAGAVCAASAEDAPAARLNDFLPQDKVWTAESLIFHADEALAAGADAKRLGEDLMTAAASAGLTNDLLYTIENIAAYGGASWDKLQEYVASGDDRSLQLSAESGRASKDGFSAYGAPDVSDGLKALFADEEAQYCFEPCWWFEKDIRAAFGKEYKNYKPSSPRVGYACVIVRSESQTDVNDKWTASSSGAGEAESTLRSAVNAVMKQLGKDAPVMTGNPALASQYWEFTLKWTNQGKWRFTTGDVVKGYKCVVSLKIVDATSRKKISELSASESVPSRISVYGIPDYLKADIPSVSGKDKAGKVAKKVAEVLKKAREADEAAFKITSLNPESGLKAVLDAQAEKAKDPWTKAVYAAGAKGVKLRKNRITFRMRDYAPEITEKYADAEDGAAWLTAALKSAMEYDLELSVALKSGVPDEKSVKSMAEAVKKAAAAAQKVFAGKDMTSALTAYLFPQPVTGTVKDPAEIYNATDAFSARTEALGRSPAYWAPLFYAQGKQTVSVRNGPHAIEMTVTGEDPAALAAAAATAVTDTQAYIPAADRAPVDAPEEALKTELAKGAVSARRNGKNRLVLTLDADQLAKGGLPEAYQAFLDGYAYDAALKAIGETLAALPENAAVKMPKNGKIKGPSSGTSVTFTNPAGANPVYLQVRGADDGKLIAECFILPGNKVTMSVPKGDVRVLYATGAYWYGAEEFFGPDTAYRTSRIEEIPDKKSKPVWSLDPADENALEVTECGREKLL